MKSSLQLKIAFALSMCVVGGFVYYKMYKVQGTAVYQDGYSISSYTPERDRQFILDEFKAHWSFLVQTADYDVPFLIDTASPNKYEVKYFGKGIIKMLCHEAKPIGFIVYYMEAPQQGRILFLDIANEYQGKHLAEKLLEYACQDLKKRGAKIVKMFTYYKNERAQKLYKRVGFKEAEHLPQNNGFYFRKEL